MFYKKKINQDFIQKPYIKLLELSFKFHILAKQIINTFRVTVNSALLNFPSPEQDFLQRGVLSMEEARGGVVFLAKTWDSQEVISPHFFIDGPGEVFGSG